MSSPATDSTALSPEDDSDDEDYNEWKKDINT